nr:MAG TPA: Thymidylate kinase [Caudoviricetes sp.]
MRFIMFIVVEGMDYSGKSSLVKELKKKYEDFLLYEVYYVYCGRRHGLFR